MIIFILQFRSLEALSLPPHKEKDMPPRVLVCVGVPTVVSFPQYYHRYHTTVLSVIVSRTTVHNTIEDLRTFLCVPSVEKKRRERV